jgi:AcrR family transcriptional regulator
MNNRSGQETKKKILQVAAKVFAEHGYAQANMRLISRSAGISVGGLYLYFKDKEELYLTLMNESLDYINRKTRETLKDIQDPKEAITNLIVLNINYAKSNSERILLQGRELGLSFGLEVKKKFFRERRRLIEEIIRDGVAKGVFRNCNPAEKAKIIFSLLRGFVVSIIIDDEALFSAEECVDLVLNGLLK